MCSALPPRTRFSHGWHKRADRANGHLFGMAPVRSSSKVRLTRSAQKLRADSAAIASSTNAFTFTFTLTLTLTSPLSPSSAHCPLRVCCWCAPRHPTLAGGLPQAVPESAPPAPRTHRCGPGETGGVQVIFDSQVSSYKLVRARAPHYSLLPWNTDARWFSAGVLMLAACARPPVSLLPAARDHARGFAQGRREPRAGGAAGAAARAGA